MCLSEMLILACLTKSLIGMYITCLHQIAKVPCTLQNISAGSTPDIYVMYYVSLLNFHTIANPNVI